MPVEFKFRSANMQAVPLTDPNLVHMVLSLILTHRVMGRRKRDNHDGQPDRDQSWTEVFHRYRSSR